CRGASVRAGDAVGQVAEALLLHQRFDVFDGAGRGAGQVDRVAVGDQHVVFDAHADVPPLRVHVGRRVDVDAGLHGDDFAGLQRTVVAHVVHVHPEVMAGAVHEE